MTDPERVDAVIVGSGINSLVCAALLGRGGWRTCVLEQSSVLGGAIRTAEITLPGFHHDVFSAWHPLFVTSPAFAVLEDALRRHGLEYATTPRVTATVFPDGSSRFLSMAREENVAELNASASGDGDRWSRACELFERDADLTMGLLSTELAAVGGIRLGGRALRRLGRRGILEMTGGLLASSRAWLEETFVSASVRGLLAPWVLHTGMGPDAAGSGFMNRAIAVLLEGAGLPVPRGGGARLVEALTAVIHQQDGLCRSDAGVARVLVRNGRADGVRLIGGEVVEATRAVVCNVPPPTLYQELLRDVPIPTTAFEESRRFRFGRAGMQIHYALDRPPRWIGESRLLETPVIHLTPGLDGVARAVSEAERGLLPAEATIVCGQPCAVDPSRAPDGRWILWIQLQELPRRPIGDAAGVIDVGNGSWTPALRDRYAQRIEERLSHHIEGFQESVLGRAVLSPADLAAANPNLVGGDIYSGACDLDQSMLWRPRPGLAGHRTPIAGLYEIGASTHPGPGLGAGSGTLVANELLRHSGGGGVNPFRRHVARA